MNRYKFLIFIFAVLNAHTPIAHAQEGDDALSAARKSISERTVINALTKDVMGDAVDPGTYNVTFTNDEISLTGNGPPITIIRTFDVAEHMSPAWKHIEAFADWKLELPRIETLMLRDENSVVNYIDVTMDPNKTWLVASASDPTLGTPARCSAFNQPQHPSSGINYASLYWPGVTLKTPGNGAQKILKRSNQNNDQPAPLGIPGISNNFPLVTSQNWQIACIDHLKNSVNGEGFLVVDPEGTKYWFDWMTAYNPHSFYTVFDPSVNQPESGDEISFLVLAQDLALFPTRIEDRFGNYVTYEYSGRKLIDIKGSDGRHIHLDWIAMNLQLGSSSKIATANYINKITLQPESDTPRVFRYDYNRPTDNFSKKWEQLGVVLSKATLPDGTFWQYNISQLNNSCANKSNPQLNDFYSCPIYTWTTSGSGPSLLLSGTIKAPSGVNADFTFTAGRVYRQTEYPGQEDTTDIVSPITDDPAEVDYPHILTKRLYGSGINATWRYQDQRYGSYFLYNPTSGPFQSFAVQNPDGTVTLKNVNQWWRYQLEGRLTGEWIYSDSTMTTLLKSTQYRYLDVNNGPYPSSLGEGFSWYVTPRQWTSLWPIVSTTTTQDGRTYTNSVATGCSGMAYCFDSKARPTKVIKTSTPASFP